MAKSKVLMGSVVKGLTKWHYYTACIICVLVLDIVMEPWQCVIRLLEVAVR